MTDEPPPVRLESLDSNQDGRRFSPSAGRNRHEIVAALVDELPESGWCLEVAAGTGEHAALAASQLPNWRWLPTERDAEALVSISAWVTHAALPNLEKPVSLDLSGAWPCPPDALDAVFASNVMHISPIATTASLFRGAAKHLKQSGRLLVYGAVFLPGERAPESNIAFDQDLKERDPAYGVRSLQELGALATEAGLTAPHVRRMQNNNVLLRFART